MEKTEKYIVLFGFVIFSGFLFSCTTVKNTNIENSKTPTKKISVTVDFSAPQKNISPYIFGVNDGARLKFVKPGSIRLGGNRTTGYNWENNKSNAGTDWHNQTDDYLIRDVRSSLRMKPGAAALDVAEDAKEYKVPYTLLTLPMAGYVAKKDGQKTEANSLDGDDWCKVINRKNAEFSLTPDLTDNVVYTDEYLNYLGQTIGNSKTDTGFKGYALDNEPALWHHTHPIIHKEKVTAEELIEKTLDLAKTVKTFDQNADVFGPSLFGYSAYDSLGSDWGLIQAKNFFRYDWFIDYYLEQMAKAEQKEGVRLLDVLDLHYYTEARGECGKRTCDHFDNDECIKARINAVRSLYDESYKEKSWIMDTGAKHFPLLPKLNASIEKYYPGTKLAFTEYNFGGGTDISGAIAQADFLGVLAEYEVYFASIWAFDKADYQFAAINIFTNYDDKGGYFADTLLNAKSSDNYVVSAYVGKNNTDGKLHVILINKEIHEPVSVSLDLDKNDYSAAENYYLDDAGPLISKAKEPVKVKNGTLTVTLEPMTINHFVLQ